MSITTHDDDAAAEDHDDVDTPETTPAPAPRPAPRVSDHGSDDVEAGYRQWALNQVTTGQLSRAEAVELVPGAARLVDNAAAVSGEQQELSGVEGDRPAASFDRWAVTAQAVAGPEPEAALDSDEWQGWLGRVLSTSPIHRYFEESSFAIFDEVEAVWNQHQHVHDLLMAGQVDPAQIVRLREGENTWLGLADQSEPLLQHLTYTSDADDDADQF